MEGSPQSGDILVSVPAQSDFLYVVRSVVASIGARLDMSYDGIDDLRLAVDEACAQLLRLPAPATTLVVRVRPSTDGMEIVASTDAETDAWPPAQVQNTLTWRILSALTDDVRFERDANRPALRFSKGSATAPTLS